MSAKPFSYKSAPTCGGSVDGVGVGGEVLIWTQREEATNPILTRHREIALFAWKVSSKINVVFNAQPVRQRYKVFQKEVKSHSWSTCQNIWALHLEIQNMRLKGTGRAEKAKHSRTSVWACLVFVNSHSVLDTESRFVLLSYWRSWIVSSKLSEWR